MDRQSHHLLRVPAPTRQTLSFCDASARGMSTWLAALPKANLGETARLLYQALIELNQLRLPSETRLQLLELLRPDVHFVCKHLEKHYLNQPIVLGERPRKVAGLCQALQNHLAVGYKLIVVRVASQPGHDRQQLLAVALQRAIHSLGALLLRSMQLYGPAPQGLWLELHQLYQLAVEQSTERLLLRDPLARHAQGLSAEQSYLATLLLGCARCNQLRQQNITRLAAALEAWSALVSLQPATAANSLFLFSPQVDGPPRYRSLFAVEDTRRMLGIDPRPLLERLEEHLRLSADNRELTRLPAARGLDDDLLRHLSSAWGEISERSFPRIPAQGSLTLCIGMSALHYQLAGQRSFNEVLELPETSNCAVFRLHNDAPDIWATAFDAQNPSAAPLLAHDHIEFVRPNLQQAEERGRTGRPGGIRRELPAVRGPVDRPQPRRLLPGLARRGARAVAGRRAARAARKQRKGLEYRRGALDSPGARRRHADGRRTARAPGATLRPAPAAQGRPGQRVPARPAAAGDRRHLATADADRTAPAVPGRPQGADQSQWRAAACRTQPPSRAHRQLQSVRISRARAAAARARDACHSLGKPHGEWG